MSALVHPAIDDWEGPLRKVRLDQTGAVPAFDGRKVAAVDRIAVLNECSIRALEDRAGAGVGEFVEQPVVRRLPLGWEAELSVDLLGSRARRAFRTIAKAIARLAGETTTFPSSSGTERVIW